MGFFKPSIGAIVEAIKGIAGDLGLNDTVTAWGTSSDQPIFHKRLYLSCEWFPRRPWLFWEVGSEVRVKFSEALPKGVSSTISNASCKLSPS